LSATSLTGFDSGDQPEDLILAPTDLLLVQPTPFCNIDCSYCYLAHRAEKTRMSVETVKAIVRFIRDVPLAKKPLSLVWHGGEPLTMPASFYAEAFEQFASGRESTPVQQHIQTNGVLIDDAWCSLFKRWSVRIGVSIDGPKVVHDAHRVDRSGHGTFDRVMRGIAKLREHGIPFTILTVLTRESLNTVKELWEFFTSLGISGRVGFIVEEADGMHETSSMMGEERLTAFRDLISRLANMQERAPRIEIREFEQMRRHLAAPLGAHVARSTNRPGAILNIDVNGNFTTFSPELLGVDHPRYGKFSWGNVHRDTWGGLARHPGFRRAYADIAAGVELCRQSCQYFSVCGGGCPNNKLMEHGTFAAAETQRCRFQVQAIADVIIERVEQEIAAAGNRNEVVGDRGSNAEYAPS
jgi:uncharacterized protein